MLPRVKTILGTMGVGNGLDGPTTKRVLELFKKKGHLEVDTAIMYQGGKTEKILGLSTPFLGDFKVATKVNPWFDVKKGVTTSEPQGGLSPECLKKQFQFSLSSLKLNKVDLLYLHAPDHQTPLLDTLRAINDLYQAQQFSEWGISNYASWEVVHIYHLCKANGWKTPSVYQGMYNCLTRGIEKELFPALRICGMRFYAYNPLAGGILTGRYKYDESPEEGRFTNKTVWGNRYRDRFWHKQVFDAVDVIAKACEAYQISVLTASLCWLYKHSQMQSEDGVIIGGSSFSQISNNLDIIENFKELPEDVLKAIDQAWEIAAPVCPQYFR